MGNVEVHSERMVFADFFKIKEALVSFEKYTGEMTPPVRRLSFERGDAVAVLIFNTDQQKVTLIEQFRYPAYETSGGWLTEVVAGVVEEGETPETTAQREVLEEVGYQTKLLIPISTFYTSPGGSSERIFLFYAEVGEKDRVHQGGGLATEHEDIRSKEYTLPQLWTHLAEGTFKDAKTLIALMWLKEKTQQYY